VALATVVLLGACSGDDDASVAAPDTSVAPADTDAEPADAAPDDAADTDTDPNTDADADAAGPADQPPPTTLPRPTRTVIEVDADTGEPTEVEVADLGPLTYDEVVTFGVDAGIWDETEGLVRVFDYLMGALPAEQVPGVDEVIEGEVTELVLLARAAIDAGSGTDQQTATLQQRLSLFAPSREVLDQVAEQAGAVITGFRGHPGQAGACAPVAPDDWDDDAWIEGCYQVVQETLPDATLRVFYPAWYADDGSLAGLPDVTVAALVKSVDTYRDLGRVGNIDVIFSATDTIDNIIDEDSVALASAFPDRDGEVVDSCQMTLFPVSTQDSLEAFEQTVAHEAWHCVQYYDGMQWSDPDWVVEGGAEFFSNVVYPSHDDEHSRLWVFDEQLETPLHQMSYESWIWWQHLSNEFSPGFVADAHREIYGAGGIGLGPFSGMDQIFHDFVADYVAGAVQDQSGAPIRRTRRFLNFPVVGENDEGKTREHTLTSWAPVRWHIPYEKELRILQTDATGDALVSMVEWPDRSDRPSWEGVFPEVRSKCTERARYAGAVTNASTDSSSAAVEFKITIDKVEKAECDPCLLGAWSLDLDTFESLIAAGVAGQGGMPPGASFELGGAYYIQFEEDATLKEQRDGLEIIAGVDGMGSITFTVDSFATGEYNADGENMSISNLVESFNEVRVDIPFGGAYSFPSAIDSASGTYTCDEDLLVVTASGLEPVTWLRVDKILEPPDAPTDPDVAAPSDS